MIVGVLTVEMHLDGVFSLKEKRQIVKSVIDRLRHRFNASVAEVDHQDDYRWAQVAAACVSSSTVQINGQLDSILRFMENDGRFQVIKAQRELY